MYYKSAGGFACVLDHFEETFCEDQGALSADYLG